MGLPVHARKGNTSRDKIASSSDEKYPFLADRFWKLPERVEKSWLLTPGGKSHPQSSFPESRRCYFLLFRVRYSAMTSRSASLISVLRKIGMIEMPLRT